MLQRKWLLPVLVVALVCVGGALAPSAPPEKPWKLAEAKLEAAKAACKLVAQEYKEGRATYEQVSLWSRRWMDAQKDATNKTNEKHSAVDEHISRLRELENVAKERVAAKRANASEAPAVEYLRIEAEMQVSRSKTSK